MLFTFSGTIAVAATKTALILGSTANIRPRVQQYIAELGDAAPTSDQGVEFQVRRATALGTSTAVTPGAPEPAELAVTPAMSGGSNCTVEPTYSTGFEQRRVINPRATYTWQPYDRCGELVLPATAANGLGWQLTVVGGASGANFKVDASVQQ